MITVRGLERNIVAVSGAVFLLALGENLWKRFIPKYLEALGAPLAAIGLFGTCQDFLIRCLNEAGARPRDDLRRLALQEGYFVDAETADRGVHATLINVVKAGLIRQLPNGNFAPATVLDTIRLRRAM